MTLAVQLSRLILAAVFAVAAVAKLRDFQGTRSAVVAFGVPEFLAALTAASLPLLELAIVVLLLPGSTAWLGALASLVLLAVFTTAIAVNIALGRHPKCHCFGQLQSEPIGRSTLARNAALLLFSGLLVFGLREQPPLNLIAAAFILFHDHVVGVGIAAAAALIGVLQIWVWVHILRQNGRLLLRVEALENMGRGGRLAAHSADPRVGTPAPNFSIASLSGKVVSLESLLALGKPILMVFADPGCVPCRQLMPAVGTWSKEHSDKLTVALVTRDENNANQAYLKQHELRNILLQTDRELAAAYHVAGTPSALVVGTDGLIHSSVASGAPAITELVKQVVNGTLPTPRTAQRLNPPPMDTLAPSFWLPDLANRLTTLSDFVGESILLLFWSPGCGYCKKMLPDLMKWQQKKERGAPRILVISSGSADENAAMSLQSTVLLDTTREVMMKFGSNGTPSAILVDAAGRVASDLAMGSAAILALLATTTPQFAAKEMTGEWKAQSVEGD